jgi:PPOX class probable F420-dependent enzyme
MSQLTDAWELSRPERGLAVVATLRADGTIQSSIVNTGVLASGPEQLAFVNNGPVKLANLRRRPQVTVTFRQGWRWAAVEGTATIAGPDEPRPGLDEERLRLLFREISQAAGGTHDAWDEFDRVMRTERRAAVLITPTRIYGN